MLDSRLVCDWVDGDRPAHEIDGDWKTRGDGFGVVGGTEGG